MGCSRSNPDRNASHIRLLSALGTFLINLQGVLVQADAAHSRGLRFDEQSLALMGRGC